MRNDQMVRRKKRISNRRRLYPRKSMSEAAGSWMILSSRLANTYAKNYLMINPLHQTITPNSTHHLHLTTTANFPPHPLSFSLHLHPNHSHQLPTPPAVFLPAPAP